MYYVHFPDTTKTSFTQSEKQFESQSQPSPAQKSPSQIVSHTCTSPEITADQRAVPGKYSNL